MGRGTKDANASFEPIQFATDNVILETIQQ